MASTSDIRSTFLNYFAKNGHEIVASSPLVPRNDPTLMFTNAGMVQFKNVFTGVETRPYKRATSSQKCVRAGGKHNDLDNVGYTARHHTFFEMLGNFSFGDYFKEQAILFGWELCTKEYGLDKTRLTVTVHSSDEEAAALWAKIAGLPQERIIRIPTSDNFWSMGDTGPCGPCTEMFWDHGDHIPGGPPGTPDADGDRFVEIWNHVFMQYEQISANERVNLPKPSVDTGMGLERITAVMQGVHSNYDTDLFKSLIGAIASVANTDPAGPHAASHRVIADHLRASGFLIADGVLPSNEGRGYVLRRIMRRAMRHAQMMGCKDPIMFKLVPALLAQMGAQYPELERANALITETLLLEETRFKSMLERGLRLLDDETRNITGGGRLSGDVAFKLYDTYGFPLDLTQDALRARNIGVDTDAFNAAMERQRAEARKAWAGSGEAATEKVWFELKDKLGGSDFLGYAKESAEGRVLALVVDGAPVQSAKEGQKVAVIANQSPFYGESGGQMGDMGTITLPKGEVKVTDTHKKLDNVIVHIGTVTKGVVNVGDEASFKVDSGRRTTIRSHHSATHLLHAALRKVVGGHISQKGSMVAPDRLRFDISHNKALTPDEIRAVEDEVNAEVRANEAVTTRLMDPESAVKAGAMALFGEKYGEEVRVVSMGRLSEEAGPNFSVELCGGTHVRRTGDIGLFKIVAESAVGAGVRRVEAVTGEAAEKYVADEERMLKEAASALRIAPAELPSRIAAMVEERRKLERELAEVRKKLATGGSGAGAAAPAAKVVNGITFSGRVLEDVPGKDLKGIVDAMKQQIGSGVVAVVSTSEGKANVVVGVTDDLTAKISAVDLVRAGAAAVGGKGGGGRPDMAQAGGPEGEKAAQALEAIENQIAQAAA